MVTLDQAWLERAVEATAARPATGLDGTATIVVGKEPSVTIEVHDGRIVGEAIGATECEVPFTPRQVEAYLSGQLRPTVEYMRGDMKPTGSTRAILAVLDALEAGRPVTC